MKSLIFSFFLFLLFSAFAQQSDSSIIYCPDTLKWEYLSIVQTADTSYPQAFLSWGLILKLEKVNVWTGKMTFKGCSSIHKKNSWVKKGKLNKHNYDYLLTQLLICNYFAKLLEIDFNKKWFFSTYNLDKKINKALKEYSLDCSATLHKFFDDTNYGQKYDKILQWKRLYQQKLFDLNQSKKKNRKKK